jgi:8-amino-7-oxononanoate synthase
MSQGVPEAELSRRLERASADGLRRELRPRIGSDFCSNDYLGFAGDLELRRRVQSACESLPLGAAGSRLIRGELELFARVEARLAAFSRCESAMLFPSGFQANLALLSALGREGDTFYSDELNHASLIDGMRMSKASRKIYPHGDLGALASLLAADRSSPGLKFIVSESLFSMDGDVAPLAELAALAQAENAALVIDEAHATGLWGSGLVERAGLSGQVFASMHTGGKSLGSAGAWVAGSPVLKDYLVNFSRPVIFSTGVLPSLAVQLEESLSYLNEVGPVRARALFVRCRKLGEALGSSVPGPIFPLILGSNERALSAQAALSEQGFDVRAIRPPTVAPGTARLRITLSALTTLAELDRFISALSPWVTS